MKKQENNVLDLGWGNPDMFVPYWKTFDLSIPKELPTKYIHGTLSDLKDFIREAHIKHENAEVKGKYIVVGNGAKQILQALFAVLQSPIYAKPPYFGRFPFLAKQAGVN